MNASSSAPAVQITNKQRLRAQHLQNGVDVGRKSFARIPSSKMFILKQPFADGNYIPSPD